MKLDLFLSKSNACSEHKVGDSPVGIYVCVCVCVCVYIYIYQIRLIFVQIYCM